MPDLASHLECFKWPLIEECRAKVDQSLDKIAETAFQRIDITEAPHNSMDVMKFVLSTNQGENRSQNVTLKPTDLILITSCARPNRKQDLLSPQVMNFLAIVNKGSKSEDGETNQPVEVTVWAPPENPATSELRNTRRQWFVSVLDCLATSLRIWDALSVPISKDGQSVEDSFPVLHEATHAGHNAREGVSDEVWTTAIRQYSSTEYFFTNKGIQHWLLYHRRVYRSSQVGQFGLVNPVLVWKDGSVEW